MVFFVTDAAGAMARRARDAWIAGLMNEVGRDLGRGLSAWAEGDDA